MVAPIALIVEQGVANVLHVHTYLVCAARFEHTLHKGYVAIALQHLIVCHGMLAYARRGVEHGHLHAVARVTRYVALNAALVISQVAPHQGIVAAACGLVEKLQPQFGLGIGCFGHHKQPRRVLVNAVHQPHRRVVGVVLGVVLQVPGYGVDKGAGVIATTRMYHQSGGFVYHEQFAILVYDVERNVLRLNLVFVTRTVEQQGYHVEWFYTVVALYRFVVDVYKASLGSSLYAVARGVLQVVEQEFVHAQQLLAFVGHYAIMLVELATFVATLFVHVVGVYVVGQFFADVCLCHDVFHVLCRV